MATGGGKIRRKVAMGMGDRETFHVVFIRPSHYDRDGYVIQWLR